MSSITIINHNIAVLAAVLLEAGALSIEAEYSGSGGTGNIYGINYAWPEGKAGKLNADVTVQAESVENADAESVACIAEVTTSFQSAFEDLSLLVISHAGYDGWDDDEGASGTFTLHANGSAELSHHTNVNRSYTSSYEREDLLTLAGHIDALAAAMKAAGACQALAQYSGYSDEGNDAEITIEWGPHPEQEIGEVTYPVTEHSSDSTTKERIATVVNRTADFDTALQDLVEAAISVTGHDGYENNDGGDGMLEIFPDGQVNYIHSNNVEDSISESHTYGAGVEQTEAS